MSVAWDLNWDQKKLANAKNGAIKNKKKSDKKDKNPSSTKPKKDKKNASKTTPSKMQKKIAALPCKKSRKFSFAGSAYLA